MEALKDCYDPEIPVNIVDLGMIHELKVSKDKIDVKMVLTSPCCPLSGMIAQNVKGKLMSLKGVKEANVEVVTDKAWTPDRMSETAKKQLKLMAC